MTTASHDRYAAAAAALASLRAGRGAVGDLSDLGDWASPVKKFAEIQAMDGSVAALSHLQKLAPAFPGLSKLLADSDPAVVFRTATKAAANAATIPQLPAAALAVYEHAASCGAWLDQYVAYACQAAPMTPRSFHEAMGMAAAATAVARRLALTVGDERFYPNLYFLLCAPSTIYRKSTGLRVFQRAMVAAGLDHLRLPENISPEALMQELGTSIPATYWGWSEEARDEWLRTRAFAAQRSWIIDEVSGLFDRAERDVYSGVLTLLLTMYDCPERHVEQTIGRGRTIINYGYLTMLGVTTPSSMAKHLANSRGWHDGQWARFVFLMPEERPTWQFFDDAITMPAVIPDGLRRISGLFPTPSAELIDAADEGSKGGKVVQVHGGGVFEQCRKADGVWEAWEAYAHACHSLVASGKIEGALHSNYGRLATILIKTAMLLATMDTEQLPVRIELRHMARAQQMCEYWRAMLHRVWAEGIQTDEAQVIDKLLGLLSQAGPGGCAARDLYRPLHLGAKQTRELLEEMERDGQVEKVNVQAVGKNKPVEYWRLVAGAPIKTP